MLDNNELTDLLNRIRSGDFDAAGELAVTHRDQLKAAIRHVLTQGNRLRREIDSSDVIHSLVLRLFPRGEPTGAPIEDGNHFLNATIRNLIITAARKMNSQQRADDGGEAVAQVADSAPSALDVLAFQEQLEAVLRTLSPVDRGFARERMEDKPWAEITSETGRKVNSIARRFRRALSQLPEELREGVGRG
jgi:DNA-directed RNA polymerase specialized sigma24 family protein